MTYEKDYTIPEDIMEQICEQGLDALPELIRIVVNAAMYIERQKHIGAGPYERTPERQGHANGFKPKTVATRMGKVTMAIPQVRNCDFYPSSLEKGIRSERALKLALAEMYVQGVSTRKVAAITEQMCGFAVSSSQVSKATAELDEQLQAWRERPLGRMKYLYLDAHYEKVRQDGQVRNSAVLLAVGVNEDGNREVLGVSVSLGEHEVHWRNFLQSLVSRGLSGIELITSDDHLGLKSARQAVFGGVSWQRCQCHLQRNAQAYVPRRSMKADVASGIRSVFNAPDRQEADALLKKTVAKYTQDAPRLADWMEENLPEGLTAFAFPQKHRRLIRTTNGLERLNRETRRRTRVASLFPNEASCLRLVTAVVMEISEDWQTGKTYIRWESDE
jgi:transposase-like protein|tara:strand:+ start:108 stop:1274 length:1167 start_codon:yes stop_codon:yes gene_type:complete